MVVLQTAPRRLGQPVAYTRVCGSPAARLRASVQCPTAQGGRSIPYGVRPEAVRIDPENGLPAVLSLVEPTGPETHMTARVADVEIVAVLRERLFIKEGETIRPTLDAPAAHFFDPETGARPT